MGDRLLTETTIPSTVDEASIVDSSTVIVCDGDKSSVHEVVENGRSRSGVLVECRICQEEEDEFCMEIPCSCKGSLKYAHHKCIQRWCNEKGDTICEICLQQFTPNYTAPFKLFQHGRNPIHFSNRERLETLDNGHIQPQVVQTTDQTAATSTSYDHQGVIYCRIIAITLMVLLVLRDALSVIQSDPDVYSVAIITLLMLRTAGIVIPVYIILISVTASLHSCNRQQFRQCRVEVQRACSQCHGPDSISSASDSIPRNEVNRRYL